MTFDIKRDDLQLVDANGDLTVSSGKWLLSLGGGPPDAANPNVLVGTVTVL